MKSPEKLSDKFRIFELTEEVSGCNMSLEEGILRKGHRFIGFYFDDKQYVAASNTVDIINADCTKELYKITFKEVSEKNSLGDIRFEEVADKCCSCK